MQAPVGIAVLAALMTATISLGVALETDNTPASFEVYHYESHAEGDAFREVFLVHALHGLEASTANVTVLLDGEALSVQWEDDDGQLGIGDQFSFVQEAFDTKHVLSATWHGASVMECRFGGGAGSFTHPDDLHAAGLSDQVRCLEFVGDQ